MVDTRVLKDSNNNVFCETFSTNPKNKKLLQIETNRSYFSPVIDIVKGYDNKSGKPYSPYTYKEIDKTPEDLIIDS
jgi:hypothetical protein